MFARLFAVASLAALAVAGPAPIVLRDQCNTGSVQCCNSVQSASQWSPVLALLGIVADVTAQVGVQCTAVSVIGGATGASCTQQTVCCSDNHFDGLINTGCNNISL